MTYTPKRIALAALAAIIVLAVLFVFVNTTIT